MLDLAAFKLGACKHLLLSILEQFIDRTALSPDDQSALERVFILPRAAVHASSFR